MAAIKRESQYEYSDNCYKTEIKEENQVPGFVYQDHFKHEIKEESQDPDFTDQSHFKSGIKEEIRDPRIVHQDHNKPEMNENQDQHFTELNEHKSEIKEENHDRNFIDSVRLFSSASPSDQQASTSQTQQTREVACQTVRPVRKVGTQLSLRTLQAHIRSEELFFLKAIHTLVQLIVWKIRVQSSDDSELEAEFSREKRQRLDGAPTPSSGHSETTSTTGSTPSRRKGILTIGRSKRKAPDSKEPTTSSTADGWHDMSEADVDPPRVSFRPARTPGPQLIPTSTYIPLELFQLFFTSTVLQTILANTNSYGSLKQQEGQKPWEEITLDDLYSFLALVIYMGFVRFSRITDYWRSSRLYSLPLPCQIMSKRKFLRILSCLHLSDPKLDAENDKKKGTPAYDRLCKIKPLYHQIVEACKSNFHPFQSIAVDERTVWSNARSGLKHIKDEPTKWGYKLFVLADSSSGYTWNFLVYEGKAVVDNGKGHSYESIMKLLELKVLGTGYRLFVDNLYTSPTLFQDLLQKKILACGMICPKRIGFPKTLGNTTTMNAPRGTIHWIREDEVLFVRWMDTREVIMCSTMHKAFEGDTVQRRVKGNNNQWSTVSVPVPAAVKDYNTSMGAMDSPDALMSYYNIFHKTQKWYKTFFFHFLDIAVVNAYILHCHMAKAKQQKPLTQEAFREALVLQLAECQSTSSSSSHAASSTSESTSDAVPSTSACSSDTVLSASALSSDAASSTSASSFDAAPSTSAPSSMTHKPAYIKGDSTNGRRKCRHCHQKTPVICTSCEVPLCFVAKRDCFNDWHSKNSL
ncbi:piggyBac transposable element-derived protein 4-like isoform X2 [Mastacembelus armatus]|uniref:piggyBac transposable element-derived protein 4-like isoform X2 n=1 Tax=Mastacembelus armatus TaxID=205130 RepID=UPI000E453FF1|nr:piggyBac transposable element-derived protein 4-like isoform X2 [Mastacembelus armatus]